MQQEEMRQEMLAAQTMFDLLTGFMKSRVIITMAQMGIADILAAGPLSAAEIATMVKAKPETTERLLAALASIGVLDKVQDKYTNTRMSAFLLTEHPVSMRPYAQLAGDPSWWLPWGKLDQCVRTGQSAIQDIFNMSYDDYLQQNPDMSTIFNRCMTSTAQINNKAIIDHYDFSPYKTIMDIGGNEGSLLASILQQFDTTQGIIFDLPHVITAKPDFIEQFGNRCRGMGGDFFKSIPGGGDLYILKQIIHDWDDDKAVQILTNCHRAMHEKAKLLIVESVLDKENASAINYLFDLHMLATSNGGRERREAEFTDLLQAAGFQHIRTILTPVSFCIIEAVKK